MSKNINGNRSRILSAESIFLFTFRSVRFSSVRMIKVVAYKLFQQFGMKPEFRSHVWHICNLLDAKLTAFTFLPFHSVPVAMFAISLASGLCQ